MRDPRSGRAASVALLSLESLLFSILRSCLPCHTTSLVTEALAGALPDSRDQRIVQISQLDLVRQSVYAIACWYEDGND